MRRAVATRKIEAQRRMMGKEFEQEQTSSMRKQKSVRSVASSDVVQPSVEQTTGFSSHEQRLVFICFTYIISIKYVGSVAYNSDKIKGKKGGRGVKSHFLFLFN